MSERDRLNHQAYMDVLDNNGPSMLSNDVYMECYRFWYIVGGYYIDEGEV